MKPGNIAAIRKAPAQRMDQVCNISHSSVNGMCQPECLTGEKLSARCPGSPGLKLPVLTSAKPQLPRNWILGEWFRSEEHTSELQSQFHLVCRLLLEKKNYKISPLKYRY